MREVPRSLVRLRDADGAEQRDSLLARLVVRDLGVGEHRLGDLVAHAMHRMEAGEGVLEDHRDVLAAKVAHLLGRQREHVPPAEHGFAADLCPLTVQQSHECETGDRLSGSRLAHDSERLPAMERVGQIRHGLDLSVMGREHDRQVADLEDDLSHSYRTLGSRNA